MINIMTKLSNKIVTTIINNIKLDEAILLCAFRAEQENRKILANKLKKLEKGE